MIYSDFDGLKLSKLGMGVMRLPGTTSMKVGRIKRSKGTEIMDLCIESGINYFDTAHVYGLGDSEKFVGETLTRYPRDSYHLATKFYIDLSATRVEKQFEKQLKRLRTDYVDFYLIHSLSDGNADRYIKSGAIDFLEKQKEAGRIRYLGFSSHAGVGTLERFADLRAWDFAQIQLNYYDWYNGTAKAEYEALRKRDIPIMVMEPVRGGKLADLGKAGNALLKAQRPDASIASWAFSWLASLPGIQVVLSGMSDITQVRDNLATFSNFQPLTDVERAALAEAAGIVARDTAAPCTACRYCTPTCPADIDIPQFMDAYNILHTEGEDACREMLARIRSNGKPADCTACAACEEHCPQGIKISGIMDELAAL